MRYARHVWRNQDGYASVLGALAVAGLAVLMVLMMAVVSLVTQRHAAQAAADLAALAGAQWTLVDQNRSCEMAGAIVAEHRFSMTRCVVMEEDITVSIALPVQLRGTPIGFMAVTARAGPKKD